MTLCTDDRCRSALFGFAVVGQVLEDHLVEALVVDQLGRERVLPRRRAAPAGGSQGIFTSSERRRGDGRHVGDDRLRPLERAAAPGVSHGMRISRDEASGCGCGLPRRARGGLAGTTAPSLAATGACGRGRVRARAARARRLARAPGVPLTGGAPPPTLMTTLRRTTTPSAELETPRAAA